MSIIVSFPDLLKNESRTDFELATNLKVAYKVQNYNNHKPYLQIFENLDKMCVEEQIDIIYAALVSAEPTLSTKVTKAYFLDYMLEMYDMKRMIDIVKQIVQGVMGITDEELSEKEAEVTGGNQEALE